MEMARVEVLWRWEIDLCQWDGRIEKKIPQVMDREAQVAYKGQCEARARFVDSRSYNLKRNKSI